MAKTNGIENSDPQIETLDTDDFFAEFDRVLEKSGNPSQEIIDSMVKNLKDSPDRKPANPNLLPLFEFLKKHTIVFDDELSERETKEVKTVEHILKPESNPQDNKLISYDIDAFARDYVSASECSNNPTLGEIKEIIEGLIRNCMQVPEREEHWPIHTFVRKRLLENDSLPGWLNEDFPVFSRAIAKLEADNRLVIHNRRNLPVDERHLKRILSKTLKDIAEKGEITLGSLKEIVGIEVDPWGKTGTEVVFLNVRIVFLHGEELKTVAKVHHKLN